MSGTTQQEEGVPGPLVGMATAPKTPPSPPQIPLLKPVVVVGGPGGGVWRTNWFCRPLAYNVPTHAV